MQTNALQLVTGLVAAVLAAPTNHLLQISNAAGITPPAATGFVDFAHAGPTNHAVQVLGTGAVAQATRWLFEHPEGHIWNILIVPLLGLLGWLGARIASRYSLGFWSWIRWIGLRLQFSAARCLKRCKPKIVTLSDYVFLLEMLRCAIIKHYENKKDVRPKIVVYVFTMQLPSDWPLWDTGRQVADAIKTPLENYYFNFQGFLNAGKADDKYEVEVKRVIIVDSCESPRGKRRLRQLKKDVNSNYFSHYIEMLHSSEGDALFHTTEGPWPGWLTDAVFYGVVAGKKRKWLWAVTTSFNTGEDLILLRDHRLTNRRMHDHLPLPCGARSFEELLNRLGGVGWGKLLSTLKTPAPAQTSPASIPAANSP